MNERICIRVTVTVFAQLIIASLTCFPTPSAAQITPNQRADNEAKSFFMNCPARHSACHRMQKQFYDSYFLSLNGHTYFMGDLIGHFDPSISETTAMGPPAIRADPLEACAWRYIRFTIASPASLADIYKRDWAANCAPSSAMPRDVQIERLMALKARVLAPPPTLNADQFAATARFAFWELPTAEIMGRSLP